MYSFSTLTNLAKCQIPADLPTDLKADLRRSVGGNIFNNVKKEEGG